MESVQSFDLNTLAILAIGLAVGGVLVMIAVLIQWSLRKARPAPQKPSQAPEIAKAPPLPEAEIYEEAVALPPAPEPVRAESAPAAKVVEPPAEPEAAAPPEAQPEAIEPEAIQPQAAPPKAPVRIGIGLRKTRENFLARIRAAITGSKKVDEIYEGLEEALIAADVGVDASMKIVEAVRGKLGSDSRPEVIRNALKAEIAKILDSAHREPACPAEGPLVVMMVGVNGVGKTTTVAKLAARFKAERGPVIVAAADTFRAAAIEQLQVWCDRAGVEMVRQSQGSDPAAVAFDAVKAAVARKAGVVLVDTAGRLQTKVNLMEELKKIARVIGRELPGAPHETWLVLDANTGQNALSQAKLFGDSVPLTGVVLAKLDSTAKGGVVIAIAEKLKVPVRFVGLGEGLDDLREFDAREFVEGLLEGEGENARGSYAA